MGGCCDNNRASPQRGLQMQREPEAGRLSTQFPCGDVASHVRCRRNVSIRPVRRRRRSSVQPGIKARYLLGGQTGSDRRGAEIIWYEVAAAPPRSHAKCGGEGKDSNLRQHSSCLGTAPKHGCLYTAQPALLKADIPYMAKAHTDVMPRMLWIN
jgi:hypothetical protein